MAFEKQSTEYSCGAASLRYALTFLGKTVEERDLRKASQTTFWHGTDESGIAKAARRYGCEVVMRNYRRFPTAMRSLIRYAQSGQPCILCVDNWMHWVAVAGANRNGVALFDPKAAEVAALVKPDSLRRRWAHFRSGDEEADPHYFFIAIRPRVRRHHPKGVADNELVHDLRRREDLREGWDRYLQDLIDIFGRRASRAEDSYPAWRFIARNAKFLTQMVSFWDGDAPQRFYRTELRNLSLVCRAYDFTMRPREEKRALVSLACILNRQALQP
jgi:hypothetical protein